MVGRFRQLRTPGPQPEFSFSLLERGLAAIGLSRLALRSAAQRYEFEAMRWYLEAAKTDRTTGNWRKISATADDVITSDGATVRARIRNLIANNGYAGHAKDVLLDWTIGTGITTQCQIAYSNDATENSKLNTIAEERKLRWMEQADSTNHLHWYEMQRLFLGETIEAGNGILYRRFVTHPDRKGRPRVLPLAYEFIESERLTDCGMNGVGKGNLVQNGLEISADGYPVAYHVTMGEYNLRTERILAESIIHGFRQDRPRMHSGLSWFAPVLPDLNYLHDILYWRLVASKVQSAIALILSDEPTTGGVPRMPGVGGAPGSSSTNASGDPKRYLEPGLIHKVGAGKVTPFTPTPSNDLDAVTKLVLRGVAVGLGTSYELLTGDYSQVNFAGGRLVRQDSRRRLNVIHSFHCRHLEDPAHCDWVNAETAFGTMRAPPAKSADSVYAVRYSQPKGDSGVNPLQDANAAAARLAKGLSTLRDEVEQAGGDWQEFLEQIDNERAYAASMNILLHQALTAPTEPATDTAAPANSATPKASAAAAKP
jgi:lambda family phage portal protein